MDAHLGIQGVVDIRLLNEILNGGPLCWYFTPITLEKHGNMGLIAQEPLSHYSTTLGINVDGGEAECVIFGLILSVITEDIAQIAEQFDVELIDIAVVDVIIT